MRLAILSRNPFLYSTKRLHETAVSMGHTAQVLDTLTLAAQMRRRLPQANRFPFDAIIPRIGTSITKVGVRVVRQLEQAGLPTSATANSIAKSRNKLISHILMQKAGLPTPQTIVVRQPAQMAAAIDAVGLPLIVKLSEGTQGRGVLLAHTWQAAMALGQRLGQFGNPLLVQRFVAEAQGRDIRIVVVGGRSVAAMERTAAPGEYRANLHLGGTAVSYQPDAALTEIAVRAAEMHQLGCCGVDIIFSHEGPLLLEVNSSPGLEGIEMASGVDVAAAIISYLEERLAAYPSS